MTSFPQTPRTRFVRAPKRGSYDRNAAYAILDEAWVAHVGLVADGGPVVIPTSYWRVGDELLIHGASSSRLVRLLAAGAEACVTVTLLDGLVMARSAFRHSMNYRSVMVFGRARVVEAAEKEAALAAFIERVSPGRMAEVRPPSAAELRATSVLAFPLQEASVKMRSGPPTDPDDDLVFPVWAGVIPLRLRAGEPEPDER
ncbi:MAG: pyridoxamine 5'-phosphate oxidase family protein [Rhodospirillales bacterium]|nr:pyridoxamine 5'-phosphate oxidase family protein [Rhodospirillales bacterium]